MSYGLAILLFKGALLALLVAMWRAAKHEADAARAERVVSDTAADRPERAADRPAQPEPEYRDAA